MLVGGLRTKIRVSSLCHRRKCCASKEFMSFSRDYVQLSDGTALDRNKMNLLTKLTLFEFKIQDLKTKIKIF